MNQEIREAKTNRSMGILPFFSPYHDSETSNTEPIAVLTNSNGMLEIKYQTGEKRFFTFVRKIDDGFEQLSISNESVDPEELNVYLEDGNIRLLIDFESPRECILPVSDFIEAAIKGKEYLEVE